MSIFLAKRIHRGDVLKEVLSGVLISFIAHLIGLALYEMLRRGTRLTYLELQEYTSIACMVIAFAFFFIMRFRVMSSLGIAVGCGLVILGPYQSNFLVVALVVLLGIASVVRSFSDGPRT
ncbi:MAG: hypothetical protein JWM46_616 [Candidatus Kaiserbacteria bacterium]|nr:hypothetical protein [Candidatus Kaiserbacteria bacterium]